MARASRQFWCGDWLCQNKKSTNFVTSPHPDHNLAGTEMRNDLCAFQKQYWEPDISFYQANTVRKVEMIYKCWLNKFSISYLPIDWKKMKMKNKISAHKHLEVPKMSMICFCRTNVLCLSWMGILLWIFGVSLLTVFYFWFINLFCFFYLLFLKLDFTLAVNFLTHRCHIYWAVWRYQHKVKAQAG
jgi:hypothetical protein